MSVERHARAKELFLVACREPEDSRHRLLVNACGDDEGLLQEVESLLLHHDDSPSEVPSTPGALLDPEPLPESIGHYRILQKVGEGGMGEVYEAEQTAPVRRRVALKLIKWGMDTKEVVARFESERQALALMNHPAIAGVFDAGATEEGRPYFAMEYVPGEPITNYCDRHRLTVRQRLDLFLQVCDGVQHAHQKGVIHRDIKPSNILVTFLDDKPVPKIIDFGIAKATSRHLTEKTVYTELGQWVGTPEYMSPEQAEWTGEDIDTRTDVYSLGVVLYELLVGAQPFDATELRRAGFDGIRRILREQDPLRPSLRLQNLGETAADAAEKRRAELPALVSALTGDLDWITMRAIEKDRTRRYGSPSELAADIRRHLRYEPVLASPPSRGYLVKKFVRRHRLGVTAAGLVLITLLCGIIGTTLGFLEAGRQRDAARLAQVGAEREAAKAQAINEFLQETLGSARPFEGLGRDAKILDAVDMAANTVGESFADQPEVEAAVHHTIGRTYLELSQYELAERWLTSALRMRENILGREHPEIADSLVSLGELALFWKNDSNNAQALFREAVSLRRRLLGEENLEVAQALVMLGWARSEVGGYEEAMRVTKEAAAIERKVLGSETPRTLESLAVLEHYRGDYQAAEEHFRKALDMLHKSRRGWSSDVTDVMSNLASMLHDKGDDRGAEGLFRETLAILHERAGDAHIEVSATSANLAMALVSQGRDDEAQRLFGEATASFPDVLTRDLPHYAQRRIAYGVLMTRRGRYEEAEQHLRGGLETFQAHFGPEDDRARDAARNLVALYETWGKADRATEYQSFLKWEKGEK